MQAVEAQAPPSFFWDKFRDATLDRYLFRTEYTFIQRFIGEREQSSRLLDLGCGSGKLAIPLQQGGGHVVGMDIDQVPLAALQQRSDAVAVVRGDAQQLPFCSESADYVIAVQSFMFGDPDALIREYHRVLRSGGVLIVQLLNRDGYKRLFKRYLGGIARLHPDRMERMFVDIPSCDDVLATLAAQGFDLLGAEGYNWLPFSRDSNSPLVPVAAAVERTLQLGRWYRLSPWVLLASRKR